MVLNPPVVIQECADIKRKLLPIDSLDQQSARKQSLKECTPTECTSYLSNADFARVNVREKKALLGLTDQEH